MRKLGQSDWCLLVKTLVDQKADLMFQALLNEQPVQSISDVSCDMVILDTDDIPGRRALRSASTDRLGVPYFKLSTICGRAFPVAASQIWNSLPDTVVSASTLRSFQHQLKTFFYFNDPLSISTVIVVSQ